MSRSECNDGRVTMDASEAARSGSLDASGLLEGYRPELHRHCYRMLGSIDDADDLVQDTLLAAWRGLPDFGGGSSLRTWLYRIATNRCLNAIRDGRRRPRPAPVPPFEPPEPTRSGDVGWLQPYPDRLLDPAERYESRSAIELAFIVALQRLPPRQAAALLLVDVLGFDQAEAAGMLGIGRTAVKGLLQRARTGVPGQPGSAGTDPNRTDPKAASELASRFADAFAADDVDAVLELLTDDAWLAMPPAPHEYVGPEAIAGFLRASAAGRGAALTLLPTAANSQPAFGCYLGTVPTGVLVITPGPAPDRISAITRFLDPRLHRRFGLPEAL